jgi:YEATS domain-containing protein 4
MFPPMQCVCLHPSSTRSVLDKPPFKVTETGWGEFTVQIRIQFISESSEKPLNLAHGIKLHHWGLPIEGPASVPAAVAVSGEGSTEIPVGAGDGVGIVGAGGSAVEAVTATVFANEEGLRNDQETEKDQGKESGAEKERAKEQDTTILNQEIPRAEPPISISDKDGDGDVKMEPSTPLPQTTEDTPAPTPTPSHPISIAAKLPVHAWQYDELVFSDPPLTFLNILNANPPTPLPPKNRRPRDQREQIQGIKKKKGRVSEIRRSVSRAVTADGEGDVIVATPYGIAGEAGSADVPLEFSAEMEKGEWNKLQEARRKIVDEMDRWRWVFMPKGFITS